MSRWFRMYSEAMRNPKVARLSDADFRLWVRLLSIAAENDGAIPPLHDLKHLLSTRLDHLLAALERLIRGRLIDVLEDGYQPHNWRERQYKSDVSTSRVQRHRAKRNVSETPPETDTESESEEGPAGPSHARTRETASIEEGGRAGLSVEFSDELLRVVGAEPCAGDQDFRPIADLLAEGCTEADVLAGIRIALTKSTERIRRWSAFTGWVRHSRQDREAGPRKVDRRSKDPPPQQPTKAPMGDAEIAAMVRRLRSERAANQPRAATGQPPNAGGQAAQSTPKPTPLNGGARA